MPPALLLTVSAHSSGFVCCQSPADDGLFQDAFRRCGPTTNPSHSVSAFCLRIHLRICSYYCTVLFRCSRSCTAKGKPCIYSRRKLRLRGSWPCRPYHNSTASGPGAGALLGQFGGAQSLKRYVRTLLFFVCRLFNFNRNCLGGLRTRDETIRFCFVLCFCVVLRFCSVLYCTVVAQLVALDFMDRPAFARGSIAVVLAIAEGGSNRHQ